MLEESNYIRVLGNYCFEILYASHEISSRSFLLGDVDFFFSVAIWMHGMKQIEYILCVWSWIPCIFHAALNISIQHFIGECHSEQYGNREVCDSVDASCNRMLKRLSINVELIDAYNIHKYKCMQTQMTIHMYIYEFCVRQHIMRMKCQLEGGLCCVIQR